MERNDGLEQPGGLEAVYFAHRQALARFLRARGAGDAADDLLQELWFKMRGARMSPVADPLSYLYRAAHNLMISRHRSAVRGERRDSDWAVDHNETTGLGLDEAISARQQIEQAEQRLRDLGERVLRIFVMFRVHGIPQRQIADELGLSLSAVEKDLQRAYRAIAGLRADLDAAETAPRRLED